MDERSGFRGSEGRVAAVDEVLEIAGGDFGGRYVKRHDLKSEVWEAQILPTLPRGGGGDIFRNVEAAIGGETFENDFFKGILNGQYFVSKRLSFGENAGS